SRPAPSRETDAAVRRRTRADPRWPRAGGHQPRPERVHGRLVARAVRAGVDLVSCAHDELFVAFQASGAGGCVLPGGTLHDPADRGARSDGNISFVLAA